MGWTVFPQKSCSKPPRPGYFVTAALGKQCSPIMGVSLGSTTGTGQGMWGERQL